MSNNASSVTRQYSFRKYSFYHSNIINENDLPNSVFGKLSDIACDVLNKTIPGTLVVVADGLVPVWRKHIKTRHVDPSWPSLLNAIIFPSMAGTVLMLSPSDRYRHCVLASRGIELVYIGGAAAHGDVIIWKQFPCYWPFVRGINRSRVNFLHKGQWRGAVMFSLICAWINVWVNSGGAGDLRPHRAHYDFIVMGMALFVSEATLFLPAYHMSSLPQMYGPIYLDANLQGLKLLLANITSGQLGNLGAKIDISFNHKIHFMDQFTLKHWNLNKKNMSFCKLNFQANF